MSQDEDVYLTVGLKKRQPQNDGYMAVISRGSPQRGAVLSVHLVEDMKAARVWFKQQCVDRPWEAL